MLRKSVVHMCQAGHDNETAPVNDLRARRGQPGADIDD
jgi:hypothetical protein